MFDTKQSLQDKKPEFNPITHPRSAPIKPDPDASAGPKGFGNTLYSMFQNDEASKQKKLQQKAYFQELTRQVNEKKDVKPTDLFQSSGSSQEKAVTSSQFSIEKPNFNIEEEKKYPRWQKKYEIENHSGINVNTSQIFGGVLQRDEAFLLKQKKEEQQREMQIYLMKQIEEKNRKKIEEKYSRQKSELEELSQFENKKTENKDPNFSSPKKEENFFQPILTESPKDKAMPVLAQEDGGEVKQLSEAVQKLIQEKEDLRLKIIQQEKEIKDLASKQNLKPERDSKTDLDKDKRKPPKPRVSSAREIKLKAQHEQERAKLAVIEEKIENARKKKMEQSKLKLNPKNRRTTETSARSESREALNKPSRTKTAVFSVQNTQGLFSDSQKVPVQNTQVLFSDSPKVPVKPVPLIEERKDEERDFDRDNLDTAGKSRFIYPDSEGNFIFQDEIDKFVNNYEKRESPMINGKSPYRNSQVIESDNRFNFTTNSLGPRRDIKPLVANKAGFPSDIFRLP